MSDLGEPKLVVATLADNGTSRFLETLPKPHFIRRPCVVEAAYLWQLTTTPVLPGVFGEAPADPSFPLPDGVKFAQVCFPARSLGLFDAGSVDAGGTLHEPTATADMHRSNSIDFEVIISGKVDIVLDSGDCRTRRRLGDPPTIARTGNAVRPWFTAQVVG